ncbi:hypothetical protein FF011L_00630 [Roseimaritima multifibrata]|uniref:Uncharacterized protein n=1 Tax=Roseimaritima multifibrata TaxID=1930274 RepID=A0A517M8Y9_9BACT|nr:hypothetical protein FF011L_00630 [Roseimaritima multifibrata]
MVIEGKGKATHRDVSPQRITLDQETIVTPKNRRWPQGKIKTSRQAKQIKPTSPHPQSWSVKKEAVFVSTAKIWIRSCYERSHWLVTKSPKANERNSDGIIHKFSRSVQLNFMNSCGDSAHRAKRSDGTLAGTVHTGPNAPTELLRGQCTQGQTLRLLFSNFPRGQCTQTQPSRLLFSDAPKVILDSLNRETRFTTQCASKSMKLAQTSPQVQLGARLSDSRNQNLSRGQYTQDQRELLRGQCTQSQTHRPVFQRCPQSDLASLNNQTRFTNYCASKTTKPAHLATQVQHGDQLSCSFQPK